MRRIVAKEWVFREGVGPFGWSREETQLAAMWIYGAIEARAVEAVCGFLRWGATP